MSEQHVRLLGWQFLPLHTRCNAHVSRAFLRYILPLNGAKGNEDFTLFPNKGFTRLLLL